MKTPILLIVIFFWVYLAEAQNVNIPDTNFKNSLIDAGVDTDENGEISYAEAEAVTCLDISGNLICDEDTCWIVNGIESLAGIEAFINLDTLHCYGNELTSLDVSNNTSLTVLSCYNNHLTSLDVSNNLALEILICGCIGWYTCGGNELETLDVSNNISLTRLWCAGNKLTSLDVTNNIVLMELSCDRNNLTSLDISNNAALKYLLCSNNPLTNLDVSNNASLEFLYLVEMPDLNQVCVWTWPFPPENVEIDITDSPYVSFTTKCSITTTKAFKENSLTHIYPNPIQDKLTIEFNENVSPKTSITLYDIISKVVYSENLNSSTPLKHTINLSSLRKGLYLINISNDHYLYTEKIIKVK